MQILATLLAEILIRTRLFGHDPNTTTMLPDLADVALHKQAGRIVCYIGREEGVDIDGMLKAVLGVFVERWRALVLVVAADAANGLVLLLKITVAVGHVNCVGFCCCPFPLFALSTGSAPCAEGFLGSYGVFWWLG